MNNEQKNLILKYFFKNHEIQSFLCNDLFQELKDVIPFNLCYSNENTKDSIRNKNKQFVLNSLKDFVSKNTEYKKHVIELYNEDLDDILDEILNSYMFYMSEININLKNIDVFKDKKSICYMGDVSVFDILK